MAGRRAVEEEWRPGTLIQAMQAGVTDNRLLMCTGSPTIECLLVCSLSHLQPMVQESARAIPTQIRRVATRNVPQPKTGINRNLTHAGYVTAPLQRASFTPDQGVAKPVDVSTEPWNSLNTLSSRMRAREV